MQLLDFLTVYLSIGAPFGVYHFLINRQSRPISYLFFLSTAVAFLWFVYAFALLLRRIDGKSFFISNRSPEQEIQNAADNLLASVSEISARANNVSFFDLKETVERYAGLTLAVQSASPTAQAHETEILRVAGRKSHDLQLGAICVHRQNLIRLRAHQARARREFLQIFTDDFELGKNVFEAALNLVRLLDDEEAKRALEHIESETTAADRNFQPPVRSEKDAWKQLPSEQTIVFRPQTSRIKLTANAPD